MGYGLCTGFSFWTSKIVIMFPGIVRLFGTFWMFLDCSVCFLELNWMFPGVLLIFFWRCTGCFLEMYRISPGVELMSAETLKHSFAGVKLDCSKA